MALWTEHTFTFDAGASKTRYLAAGPEKGPLLIFIHGWIGCAETWKPQIAAFSALGFRVVAPDCRGYGGSTNTTEVSDYRTERHNRDMLALLHHLERPRAVWIGHDWGAPLVWGLAAHHPEVCVAVSCMCVPYRAAEFGPEHLANELSDRTIYPEAEFKYAQWEYMVFHNEQPEAMRAQLEADPEASMKALFMGGNPAGKGQPAITAFVRTNGGFFKGGPPQIPIEYTLLAKHPEVYEALVRTVRDNGTQGPNDYYRNFEANAKYAEKSVNGGVLTFPVLFIGASYDFILDTVTNPKLSAPMREYCSDLTEVNIDAGHWVALEKPQETNAALAKWLVESVKDYWPSEPFVRTGKAKVANL